LGRGSLEKPYQTPYEKLKANRQGWVREKEEKTMGIKIFTRGQIYRGDPERKEKKRRRKGERGGVGKVGKRRGRGYFKS